MKSVKIFQTNGDLAARAYAVGRPPPPIVPPVVEIERVEILDPRRTVTLLSDRPRCPGARDPAQMEWRGVKPLRVELPDGRPIMKAQRVFVDPDLVEQWEQEEQNGRRAGTR